MWGTLGYISNYFLELRETLDEKIESLTFIIKVTVLKMAQQHIS